MIVFCSTVFRQILGLLKPIVYEDISSSIWTTFHRVQKSTSSSSLTSEHSSKTKFFLFYLCLRGRKTEKTESQSQRAIEENIDWNKIVVQQIEIVVQRQGPDYISSIYLDNKAYFP